MRDRDIRPGVRRLFRLAAGRRDSATETDDEIRLHLALRAEQLEREGLSPEAARAEAERRFGDLGEAGSELRASAAASPSGSSPSGAPCGSPRVRSGGRRASWRWP